jgi:pimeloyl-ACP methyl ester carboxylesterase
MTRRVKDPVMEPVAREGTARIEGTRLHIRDVGHGPPVLLINGVGAHVEMWRPLEATLDGLRLISFDAPGMGRSQTSLVPRTMRQLARLVEGLLDMLDLERVDVLGYSFGGALAQQLAVQAPERVRRLVLAATTPGWGGVPGSLGALLGLSTPLRYHSRQVYTRTAGIVAGGRARTDPAYVQARWAEREAHPPSTLGYSQQLWAMGIWSGLAGLSHIEAPTLVLLGDDDPVVPISNALMMASRIPHARVMVAKDEGHFLLLDPDSPALPSVRSFLTAPSLADEPVWRDGLQPTPCDAQRSLRRNGIGAMPWGMFSAAVREAIAIQERRDG